MPAQQRFKAGDFSAVEIDLGLEIQQKLVARNRVTEFLFKQQLFHRAFAHGRRVELEIIAPEFFRVVHRRIGIADHGVDIDIAGRRGRDADARRDKDLVAFELERPVHRFKNLPGHNSGACFLGKFCENYRELVTAEAADGILGAHARAQPPRNLQQQLVTNPVAERIVDRFETVEVDEHDAGAPAAALRLFQRMLQAVIKQHAIGQPCQTVMAGKELEILLQAFALGDAFDHADKIVGGTVGVAHQRGGDGNPDFAAVLVPVASFDRCR